MKRLFFVVFSFALLFLMVFIPSGAKAITPGHLWQADCVAEDYLADSWADVRVHWRVLDEAVVDVAEFRFYTYTQANRDGQWTSLLGSVDSAQWASPYIYPQYGEAALRFAYTASPQDAFGLGLIGVDAMGREMFRALCDCLPAITQTQDLNLTQPGDENPARGKVKATIAWEEPAQISRITGYKVLYSLKYMDEIGEEYILPLGSVSLPAAARQVDVEQTFNEALPDTTSGYARVVRVVSETLFAGYGTESVVEIADDVQEGWFGKSTVLAYGGGVQARVYFPTDGNMLYRLYPLYSSDMDAQGRFTLADTTGRPYEETYDTFWDVSFDYAADAIRGYCIVAIGWDDLEAARYYTPDILQAFKAEYPVAQPSNVVFTPLCDAGGAIQGTLTWALEKDADEVVEGFTVYAQQITGGQSRLLYEKDLPADARAHTFSIAGVGAGEVVVGVRAQNHWNEHTPASLPRRLRDELSGISLWGEGIPHGAQLLVTALNNQEYGAFCGEDEEAFAAYNIALSLPHSVEPGCAYSLFFPVGSAFNGHTLRLLHVQEGSENQSVLAQVTEGVAAGRFQGLSPFVLIKANDPKPTNTAAPIPMPTNTTSPASPSNTATPKPANTATSSPVPANTTPPASPSSTATPSPVPYNTDGLNAFSPQEGNGQNGEIETENVMLPQTGDTRAPLPWLIGAALAFVCAFFLTRRRKNATMR